MPTNNFARLSVQPGNSDLCFVWDGTIAEAMAHLEQHCVDVEKGPVERHGARGRGTNAYFRDPDGSLLESTRRLLFVKIVLPWDGKSGMSDAA
jgi:catechol 2,3-dioxygenase-like lactoylglutathione lyase family enzyme